MDDVTIGSLAGWDGCALSEVGTRDGEAVRAALWAPDRVVWDEDLGCAVSVPRVQRVTRLRELLEVANGLPLR